MSTVTEEAPKVKMKFRLIREAGKPVGPHVDFARDDNGEIVYGKPYVEAGIKMPGDPVERTYYPGDVVESTTDLAQFNGTGEGKCKSKFERVYDDGSTAPPREVTLEEAKAVIARHEAAGSSSNPPSANPPAGDGRAKLTAEVLQKKSFVELQDMVRVEGIDLQGAVKKEDVVKRILATLNK